MDAYATYVAFGVSGRNLAHPKGHIPKIGLTTCTPHGIWTPNLPFRGEMPYLIHLMHAQGSYPLIPMH